MCPHRSTTNPEAVAEPANEAGVSCGATAASRGALILSFLILASTALPSVDALAAVQCSGHKFLSKSRPEATCLNLAPQVFVSPDKSMRAVVFPANISLDTTPDMESRVVIRSSAGSTVTSKDHSSPRGMNGYYVLNAMWSPDSQFFAYSMSSSGGHSPWSFPIMVFSRKKMEIRAFGDMINDNPTVSGDFKFSGPHALTATTWRQPGDLDNKVPVTVDLEEAFEKLKPSSD